MIYEILNDKDDVINRIAAEQWFVEKYYPGRYRLEELPESGQEAAEESESELVPDPAE